MPATSDVPSGTVVAPTTRQPRLWRLASWAVTGEGISRLAMLGTIGIALGALTPSAFAAYTALHAAALFTASVWDFGTSPYATRLIAGGALTPGQATRQILVFRARLLLPAAAVVALSCYAASAWERPSVSTLALVALLAAAANAQITATACLRGALRFRASAAAVAVGRFAATGATLAVAVLVSDRDSGHVFLACLAVGEMVSAVWAVALLRRVAAVAGTAKAARMRLGDAAAFAVSGLLILAYNRLDILIVAAIAASSVLEAYAPASRIQDGLLLVPLAVSMVLFPYLSRIQAERPERFHAALIRPATASIALSIAAALMATLLAEPVLGGLTDYATAVEATQIIVWTLPLAAFNSALVAALNARGEARRVSYAIAAAFVTALGAMTLLVPIWGARGAAIATIVREIPCALLLSWFYLKTHRDVAYG